MDRGDRQHVTDEQVLPRGIPEATVARLPVYLRALTLQAEQSTVTVSSEELAAASGVNSAKVRKDLSHLGSYGVRGVGYDVDHLIYQISRELGLTQDWPVAIVGIGNLGQALAGYGGFATRGFRVASLFDCAPEVVGGSVAGLTVRHIDEMESVMATEPIAIGVVATPAAPAQGVCDRLVAVGVRSVLNFAPCVLAAPDGVDIRKVDLSTELQILAFHEQRKTLAGNGGGLVFGPLAQVFDDPPGLASEAGAEAVQPGLDPVAGGRR
jgi:redox-sensing transcriptional repressor